MRLCSENSIDIYISNPSFEFWLLLHFEDDKITYIQRDLENKLGKHLGTRYVKSVGINEWIDDEDVKKALFRSKNLLPDGDPIQCAKTSPSTCVHLLIEKLIK